MAAGGAPGVLTVRLSLGKAVSPTDAMAWRSPTWKLVSAERPDASVFPALPPAPPPPPPQAASRDDAPTTTANVGKRRDRTRSYNQSRAPRPRQGWIRGWRRFDPRRSGVLENLRVEHAAT